MRASKYENEGYMVCICGEDVVGYHQGCLDLLSSYERERLEA